MEKGKMASELSLKGGQETTKRHKINKLKKKVQLRIRKKRKFIKKTKILQEVFKTRKFIKAFRGEK